MLKIGLTGGIGSGKSTVAKIFEMLGTPVYYADDAAKMLMEEDEELKKLLQRTFGEATYLNGKLNTTHLSAQVFGNEARLKELNSIVHPVVIAYGKKWMENQKAPYAIKEAALFFESGSQAGLDYMIGVYAPQPLRIHRTMQRQAISRQQVLERMDKQLDEGIKMKLCDFVITNDEQQLVLPQVLQLHRELLQKSGATG
jgi:dephospho-CoA kinase